MQDKLLQSIFDNGIIAIIRGVSPDQIIPTVEALVEGGISTLEITFQHKDQSTIERSLESMRRVSQHFGEAVQMGAGTVLTCQNVDDAIACGAKYMISPNVDPEVIRYTKERGCLSFPGALTPTEAVEAAKAGADAVKLFPAGDLGPSYIKAVRGPLAHLNFLAVGGVSPDNMASFLDAGVCGFGIGGNLVNLKAIEAGDFAAITRTARAYVNAWEAYKAGKG